MSETKQGAFDMTYHHIDAPTVQDDEYGRQFHKRILSVPTKEKSAVYRTELLGYLSDLQWIYRRKLDGSNMRVQWNGEQALWNGKSNAYQCGSDITEYMNNVFQEEIFEEKFGRDKNVVIFGEIMGPKVQTNELKLDSPSFIVFDVNINGTWLYPGDVCSIADYFGLNTCYTYMDGGLGHSDTLENLIKRVAGGEFKDWEGIVAHPLVELRDQGGHRVIVKIKNRDYLRNEQK